MNPSRIRLAPPVSTDRQNPQSNTLSLLVAVVAEPIKMTKTVIPAGAWMPIINPGLSGPVEMRSLIQCGVP